MVEVRRVGVVSLAVMLGVLYAALALLYNAIAGIIGGIKIELKGMELAKAP
jgi:hypothetical protein